MSGSLMRKRLVIALVCIALSAGIVTQRKKIMLLHEYAGLKDAVEPKGLDITPVLLDWNEKQECDSRIETGPFAFCHPWDTITKITLAGVGLYVHSPNYVLFMGNPHHYGFETFRAISVSCDDNASEKNTASREVLWDRATNQRDFEIKPAAWEDILDNELLLGYWKRHADHPFEWYKEMLSTAPRHLGSLVWMNTQQLQLHLVYLQRKNFFVRPGEEYYMFKSGVVKGVISLSSSQAAISCWHEGAAIEQSIMVYWNNDSVDLDSLRTLLTSLDYADPVPHQYRDYLQALVTGLVESRFFEADTDTAASLIRYGSTDLLAKILDALPNIDARTSYLSRENRFYAEVTLLHIAVIENQKAEAEFLLRHGANLDTKNGSGVTPVQMAIENNNSELVKLLSEFKAPRGTL